MSEIEENAGIPRPPKEIRDALAEQHAREAEEDRRRREARATRPDGPEGEDPRIVTIPTLRRRVRQLLATIIGPKVGPQEYRHRLRECWQCPELEMISKGYKEWMFCRRCGCWRWWLADLRRKRRYANHICPLGRHKTGCVGCGE